MHDEFKAALDLLREAYEGPEDPRSTWFVDNEPASGLFGTLDSLTAEQASAPSGCGRNTVAAHTEHLRFSLAVANAYIRGEQPQPDWESSWQTQRVSPTEWDTLRSELRQEYQTFLRNTEAGPPPGLDAETTYIMKKGFLAAVAHGAYHLGAVRQLAFRG